MLDIFKKKAPEKITYDYYKKNKGIRNYFFKSYNYRNLNPEKKRNRLSFLITTFTIAIMSFIGIFNGFSDAIYYLIISMGFLSFGLAAFFLGFLRSFYVLFAYLSVMLVNYLIFNSLNTSNYPIFTITIDIIMNLSVIFISYSILKRDFMSIKIILLNYFYKDDDFLGIDLDINNFIPIENYNNLIKITIDISKNYDADKLNNLDTNFFKLCEEKKFIVLAHRSLSKIQNYEIFICTDNPDYCIDIVTKLLTKIINYTFKVEQLKKDVWKTYLEELYPDDYAFLKENTKMFVSNLEKENFDFSKEYPLSFLIQFDNKGNADKYKKQFKKLGYEKSIDFPGDDKDHYFVAVQQTTKLGLQRSLKITKDAYDHALKYNGLLIEWRIGELVENMSK